MPGLPEIDLLDKTLFGNEASELEDEGVFYSYALNRKELSNFLDETALIEIACSYKGEGKSGLLRLLKKELISRVGGPILVAGIGTDLSPPLTSEDSDEWTRAWKERIFKLIAAEVGNRVGVAFSDDAIALVEHAELAGFKSKSLLSAVIDRLKSSAVPIDRNRSVPDNLERVLQRYASGKSTVWVVIDDVDQNFENTTRQRIKIATFFIACRQIVASVPEIRFRVAIRPNIWAIVKRQFEGLSHLQQYIVDLSWTADEYRSLLARRVEGYLQRKDAWKSAKRHFAIDQTKREQQLIALVFDDPMPWGGDERYRHPNIILHTLSRHRPRWLVELSKEAAKSASAANRHRISLDDITAVLANFGKKRIDDTVAEFQSQCPQVGELISAFYNQNERFSTDELVTTIRNRIMGGVHPRITGAANPATEIEIAHFLFHIGFLAARRELGGERYEHLMYADAPNLLKDRTNIDFGMTWEIHPIFRQTLKLKNVPTKSQLKH